MEISQKLLCFLFLISFAAGLILGGVYDLLRLSRMLLGLSECPGSSDNQQGNLQRLKKIAHFGLLFLEDFLFVLLGGTCLLLILYFFNDGQFRFPALIGLGCGFFVYRATMSKPFLRLSTLLVRLIHRIIGFGIMCIKVPLKFLAKCGYRIFVLPVRNYMVLRQYRKKLYFSQKSIQEFGEAAAHCFGDDLSQVDLF